MNSKAPKLTEAQRLTLDNIVQCGEPHTIRTSHMRNYRSALPVALRLRKMGLVIWEADGWHITEAGRAALNGVQS